MTDFAALRKRMVERQIAARGLIDARLLDAFLAVPREEFVAPDMASRAYDDGPLPIGFGQTISQPYIVALTIAEAGIAPGDRVLEIGAGSGYAAAIIGQIAGAVTAIERQVELAALAAARMQSLRYDNVQIVTGDGSVGYPAHAPFDAIVAAASGSHVPQILVDQLKPGGRIVMPVGEPGAIQQLVRIVKDAEGRTAHENLAPVRFVPMIGRHGFPER